MHQANIKTTNHIEDYFQTFNSEHALRPIEISYTYKLNGSNVVSFIQNKSKVRKSNLTLIHPNHEIIILDTVSRPHPGIPVADCGRSCDVTIVYATVI